MHEMEHVGVALDYLGRAKPSWQKFEKTYSSLTECDYYRQKYVTGFPNSGRIPDLRQEIDRTVDVINSQQRTVDDFFQNIGHGRWPW